MPVNPLGGYSWRHTVAIERPEYRDPHDWTATRDPHKRKVEFFTRDKTKLHLWSALTVDLDDWPTWHARVGFIDPVGEYADRQIPLSQWTIEMEQAARRVMQELTKLPRSVEKYLFGRRPAKRPVAWHWFTDLTPLERDWMTVIMNGGLPPSVKIKEPRFSQAKEDAWK